MTKQNIKLVLEYKGTNFAGWQVQTNQTTIQGSLNEAVKSVTGLEVSVMGAGRTDAGVHSLGQVAAFRIDHHLEPERYKEALNYYLPDDIRVNASEAVDWEFHPIRDARTRRYRYLISREKSALYRELRWEHPGSLDYDLLQKAAALVVGRHDFTPFCVVTSRQEDNHCEIAVSRWYKAGPLLIYEIRGNRFLHSMVRSLVGGMVNLATDEPDRNAHNLTLDQFGDIINAQTDERIKFTAPAHGLYQVSVGY